MNVEPGSLLLNPTLIELVFLSPSFNHRIDAFCLQKSSSIFKRRMYWAMFLLTLALLSGEGSVSKASIKANRKMSPKVNTYSEDELLDH